MALTLRTLASGDLDAAYDTDNIWVETITVGAIVCPSIVQFAADPAIDRGETRAEGTARVRRSDIPTKPDVDQALTIDGESWRVTRVSRYSAWEWAMDIETDTRLTFQR